MYFFHSTSVHCILTVLAVIWETEKKSLMHSKDLPVSSELLSIMREVSYNLSTTVYNTNKYIHI